MENTIENKEKFFGLYLGQQIAKETKYPNSPTINVTSVIVMELVADYHLELKPLSEISDEDVAKLSEFVSLKFSSVYTDKYVISRIKESLSEDESLPRIVSDKLRELGYLIGFHSLTPDQIIEYGWVKIKKL